MMDSLAPRLTIPARCVAVFALLSRIVRVSRARRVARVRVAFRFVAPQDLLLHFGRPLISGLLAQLVGARRRGF